MVLRPPKYPVTLALGSNLGDRAGFLGAAVAGLEANPHIEILAKSHVYESVALTESGLDTSKPAYLNAVVLIATSLEPARLLEAVQQIELSLGRDRSTGEHWADRTIDIDIIDFAGRVVDEPGGSGELGGSGKSGGPGDPGKPGLQLPHPQAKARDFVIIPWLEVDPAAELPGLGPISNLEAANLGFTDSLRRLDAEEAVL